MTEKFDPRFDARYQPGFEQESMSHVTPTPEPETPVTDEPGPGKVERSAVEVAETVPEPNPFERTLWVVAVVLVVGGVAVAFWANSLNYFGTGDAWNWKEIIQSSGWAVSGPMITVGLATGVGLLFRRANAWSPPE